MQLNKCKAIITGGASGLGEATTRKINQLYGEVVILDLSEENGQRLEQELGERVTFYKTDVTNEENVLEAIDFAYHKLGEINTVINCAGIAYGQKLISTKEVHSLEAFAKVISVNLIGTFNVIRIAAEKMVGNDENEYGERGVIINTASVAAYEGQIGQAAYSASKGGVVGMMLPLARELAQYGIRVMTIAPGLFHTPMFDTLPEAARESLGNMVPFPKRLGYPEEFAKLVESIIDNPMLNGETIRLDGAIRMQPK